VLYRLPEILPKSEVYIAEGEKDVDCLWAHGIPATTNPMGAGKWRKEFNAALRGKAVILVADNDPAGRAHTLHVARHLRGIAASVTWIEALPDGAKDVSAFFEAAGSVEALRALAAVAPAPPLPTAVPAAQKLSVPPDTFYLPATIPQSTRAKTIFAYACSLRHRGMNAYAIDTEIRRVNEERCQPPLKSGELNGMAKRASQCLTEQQVREANTARPELAELIALAQHLPWPGKAGSTQRAVILAILDIAYQVGSMEISVSQRQL
jgi:hypothetical protein